MREREGELPLGNAGEAIWLFDSKNHATEEYAEKKRVSLSVDRKRNAIRTMKGSCSKGTSLRESRTGVTCTRIK
jgi:hypothetical protein